MIVRSLQELVELVKASPGTKLVDGRVSIAFDPILRQTAAAHYIGLSAARSIRRFPFERVPLPCTGKRQLYGYRLSTLNRHLERSA